MVMVADKFVPVSASQATSEIPIPVNVVLSFIHACDPPNPPYVLEVVFADGRIAIWLSLDLSRCDDCRQAVAPPDSD